MRAVSIIVAVRCLDLPSRLRGGIGFAVCETEYGTQPDRPCVDDSTGRQWQFAGAEQLHDMAWAVVAAEAAGMDPAGKLPGEAAAGSPAARVGEWQPCVVEQGIAMVVVDSSLDRGLDERDRTAVEDTRREGDDEFP